MENISENPNLTLDIINDNPDKPWIGEISENQILQ